MPKYLFRVGERCHSDPSLRYVDRLEPDRNGHMTPTCRITDTMMVPADMAGMVATALNNVLGHIEVPASILSRVV